jgi:Plant transposon protein
LKRGANRDLYVWHWFAGRFGTSNELTTAGASPLFNYLRDGKWCPSFEYILAGEQKTIPHWLGDDIYPRWSIFAKPLNAPTSLTERHYTSRQVSVRNDIQRCFGVLQLKFNALRVDGNMWYNEEVLKEGMACAFIHNMLVELKIQGNLAEECDELGLRMTADETVHERYIDYCPHENSPNLDIASSNAENAPKLGDRKYCSLVDHNALQATLMKHLWEMYARTGSEI